MSAPITKREPALLIGAITTLVTAALNVAIVFGLGLTAEQAAALAGLTLPVAGLVQAIITRGAVTSPATAERQETEAYEAGVADAEADVAEPEGEDSEEEYRPKRALVEPVDPSLA